PRAEIDTVSEYVYGGFQARLVHPVFGDKVDSRRVYTEDRPFNRYIAPGVCNGPINAYVCPSDSFMATTRPETPCNAPVITNDASWTINGNSYAMNWNWLSAPPWNS